MPHMTYETLDDLLISLGGISPRRVLFDPLPGTATVKDVLRYRDGPRRRLVELVDGILVEKPMGFSESLVGSELNYRLTKHLKENGNPGVVTGADGTIKLLRKLVRLPDIAFVSWDRLPNREVPAAKVPEVVPNLAVEVLSKGNTSREMERKLKEYFLAGVELVWFVDPDTRTVTAFTSPDEAETLSEKGTLTGGAVLPGFAVPVAELFACLPPKPKKSPAKGKRKKA
jgi:Uma2 family endonuclease